MSYSKLEKKKGKRGGWYMDFGDWGEVGRNWDLGKGNWGRKRFCDWILGREEGMWVSGTWGHR